MDCLSVPAKLLLLTALLTDSALMLDATAVPLAVLVVPPPAASTITSTLSVVVPVIRVTLT